MADLAPLTEDEVKRFMERWYLDLLDTHAPMEDVAACVAASCIPTSAARSRLSRSSARACSCETRDSLTPISAPICFIVASPK